MREVTLVTLRRLYHHVIHGGQTSDGDRMRIGFNPTAENLAAEIRRLEDIQAAKQ